MRTPFTTWVDQWVESYTESSASSDRGNAALAYPDDARNRVPRALQPAAEGSQRSFSHFWYWHRERGDLGGQSLAMLHSLMGADERNFQGYLVIRSDLDPAEYLTVPEVRLAWRFLEALGEALDSGDPALIGAGAGGDGGGSPGVPVSTSWSLLRRLDGSASTADLTSRELMERLYGTDLIDPTTRALLTTRARELYEQGSPGAFYRAFLMRSVNRCPWRLHDGLAEASLLQIHALFLLYLIHRSKEGLSAYDLSDRLEGIARVLKIERGPEYLPRERSAVAAVVLQRFLNGFGRRFGLLQPEHKPSPGTDPFACRYRESAFATRVLHWQATS